MYAAPPLNIQDFGNRVDLLGDRTTLELEENETASLIPTLFLKQVPPPEKNLHLPVTQLKIIQYTTNDPAERIAQFEGIIKDHVETKIQLFFYQLLLVSGLGLKFFQEKAYYQAGLNTRKKQEEVNQDFKAVEAHCATLVTLFASDRTKHDNCFISEDDAIERVFFGDETSYGRSWNMTTTLPSCVNIMDSGFEWQHKSQKYVNKTFRKCCIKLLNNASKSRIDPVVGLKQYILKGIHFLVSVKESQKDVGYKQRINDIYLEVFNKYWKLTNGEKALKTFKTLIFSVLSEGEINFPLAHNFMIGKLREEVIMQRKLFGLSQRIQQLFNLGNDKKKDLRLLTKGVALERTSSEITRWLEEFFTRNNHQLTDTSGAHVNKCLSDNDFLMLGFQYLGGRTTVHLDGDFRNGIKAEPLNILIASIENCLNSKKIQNKLPILLHSLHRISKYRTIPTAQGVNVRQHLSLTDPMMQDFLEGHPQRRVYIRRASSDAQVQALAAIL